MAGLENVIDARITGEQLDLVGDEYVVTDDAILDGGSNATYGVRVVDPMGRHVVDFEIFQGDPRNFGCLSVYPLDGLDRPVVVNVEHFDFKDGTVSRIARLAMQMRGTIDYEKIADRY